MWQIPSQSPYTENEDRDCASPHPIGDTTALVPILPVPHVLLKHHADLLLGELTFRPVERLSFWGKEDMVWNRHGPEIGRQDPPGIEAEALGPAHRRLRRRLGVAAGSLARHHRDEDNLIAEGILEVVDRARLGGAGAAPRRGVIDPDEASLELVEGDPLPMGVGTLLDRGGGALPRV